MNTDKPLPIEAIEEIMLRDHPGKHFMQLTPQERSNVLRDAEALTKER